MTQAEIKSKALAMYAAGAPMAEIIAMSGSPAKTVYDWASAAKISRKNHLINPPELVAKILRLHGAGYSKSEICRKLDMTRGKVGGIIDRAGGQVVQVRTGEIVPFPDRLTPMTEAKARFIRWALGRGVSVQLAAYFFDCDEDDVLALTARAA